MCVALHAVAARVEPAGYVDDGRAGMRRKPRRRELIQHDRAGDDAAVHGRVLIRKREVIIERADDLLGLRIVYRAAAAALLSAGINRL